jgi:hypothetical protein
MIVYDTVWDDLTCIQRHNGIPSTCIQRHHNGIPSSMANTLTDAYPRENVLFITPNGDAWDSIYQWAPFLSEIIHCHHTYVTWLALCCPFDLNENFFHISNLLFPYQLHGLKCTEGFMCTPSQFQGEKNNFSDLIWSIILPRGVIFFCPCFYFNA